MAEAEPFRGLRYDPVVAGGWGRLLGPPYDVITPAQREALLAASPYQITHVEAAPGGATEAARLLGEWRQAGVLRRDRSPAYYVERHRFRHRGEERERTTLYAAVRLTAWDASHADGGGVRPHEWTMSGPKRERASLREAARADVSPLMVLAPDAHGRLAAALSGGEAGAAAASGTDPAGEEHSLHVVNDARAVTVLRDALGGEMLYIADGHHRYESALEYRDRLAAAAGRGWTGSEAENRVLMGIILANDAGLVVGATHRLLHMPPPGDALEQLRTLFRVETVGRGGDGAALAERVAARAGQTGGVTIGVHGLGDEDLVLLADERTRAARPASIPEPWGRLGAAVLQFGALGPVFGIDEEALRRGEAVTYEHDAASACARVEAGEAHVAFLLMPPTLGQIFASADGGERMPQKSTYFTPKLPTGVVLHAFDAGPEEIF